MPPSGPCCSRISGREARRPGAAPQPARAARAHDVAGRRSVPAARARRRRRRPTSSPSPRRCRHSTRAACWCATARGSASSPAPGCSARSSTVAPRVRCRCASWPPSSWSRSSPGAPAVRRARADDPAPGASAGRRRRASGSSGCSNSSTLLSFLSNHSYLITVQIVAGAGPGRAAGAGRRRSRASSRLLYRGGTRVGQIGNAGAGAQRQAVRAHLAARRAGRPGGRQLPVRDGQRRAWRAVAEDRSGQRPDPARRRRPSTRPRWRRRAGASRRHCATSATRIAPAGSWSATRPGAAAPARSRPGAPLAAPTRPRGLDGAGDLRRRPRGRAAMRRCWPRSAPRSIGSCRPTTPCSAALPRRSIRFPTRPGGWWNRLLQIGEQGSHTLDLKKAGIFPIVHGVRSLALRDHVQETATAARLDALVARGRLLAGLRDRSGRQPALPDGAEAQGRAGRARHAAAR